MAKYFKALNLNKDYRIRPSNPLYSLFLLSLFICFKYIKP